MPTLSRHFLYTFEIMEEKKLSVLATGLIALAVVLSALILGSAYKYKFIANETISTTGLAEKEFTSDLANWSAQVYVMNSDKKEAYSQLKIDIAKVREYLKNKGFADSEIVLLSVNAERTFREETTHGPNGYETIKNIPDDYKLYQYISIESKKVDLVEKTAREITDLMNEGINIDSESPNYYYSKLEDLKISLIANATENGTTRAKNIAEKGNSTLGSLKSAVMGVFQITGKHSSEDYSYGGIFNTSDKEKKASITMRLEFGIR